jgi:xanthine dehydrogenase YagS FAD-binding subunit
MKPYDFARAHTFEEALDVGRKPGTSFIAGGTDLVQLLQNGIAQPYTVLDISDLPLDAIATTLDGLRIGALCRLSDVARDPALAPYRVIVEALQETASPMVRNMATMGGNLLQRTRCLYFRDGVAPCNKRVPGSGCGALQGRNALNAVLGTSEQCIAAHPSDLAVALVACDAEVMVMGTEGERSVLVESLHLVPGDSPDIETVLMPGELITAIFVPRSAAGRVGRFVKARHRASFEWALASCAVSLGIIEGAVEEARVVLGGVATKPWRVPHVEQMLIGSRIDEDLARRAGEAAVEGAQAHGDNAYKIPLARNVVARALLEAARAVEEEA